MGTGRETAGVTVRAILGHVRSRGGADAVRAVLATAGLTGPVEVYEDARHWWSYQTKIDLFEAAARVLDDDEVARRIGERILEHSIGTPLRVGLTLTGGPRQLFRLIAKANHKFSTAADMSVVRVGRDRATVRYVLRPEFRPERHDCLYTGGLLTQVPRVFGQPAAMIRHPECQLRGDAACVFEACWRGTAGNWLTRRFAGQRPRPIDEAIAGQLEQLQLTVAELVAARDPDRLLFTLAERAGYAVDANAFLLRARSRPDRPHRVYSLGLSPDEVRVVSAELDAGDVPGRLVAPIRSAEQEYGHLVTFSDGFLDTDRQLLRSYANLTAMALDSLSALDAAATRQRTAESLLALARSLTRVTRPAEVAEVTAEAGHAVTGADVAAVLLRDGTGRLVLQAHRGWTAEQLDRLAAVVIRPDDDARVAGARLAHPQAARAYHRDGGDRWVRELLGGLGLEQVVVAGIATGEEAYGILAAGVRPGASAGDLAELMPRLSGIADQAAGALRTCRLLERTWRLAHVDALTGLPNRRWFLETLQRAVADPDPRAGLLFLDLDGFKRVNDTLGHHAGDDLLRAVADRLRSCTGPDDAVARLAGDEFVLLVAGVTDEEQLAGRVAAVRAAFAEPVTLAGQRCRVGVSVGAARVTPGSTADEMLHRADTAMYRVKRAGRTRSADRPDRLAG